MQMQPPIYRRFLETLVNSNPPIPESQIALSEVENLKALLAKSDEEIETTDLLAILNRCAYFSLASSFVMQLLNIAYKELCEYKGVAVNYGPTDKDGYTP